MKPVLAVLSIAMLAAGCGRSPDPVCLSCGWPTSEPDDYKDVTESWTRSDSIQTAYQAVLDLHATYKSPEWRAAYAARDAGHRRLTGAARDQRMAQAQAEMEGPIEFELMVTTWDRRENDLDRGARSVWSVVLVDDAGNEIKALEIIKDKRPTQVVKADFPALGDFATAYVARFPPEAKERLLGPSAKQLRMRMSSSRGGIELVWEAK